MRNDFTKLREITCDYETVTELRVDEEDMELLTEELLLRLKNVKKLELRTKDKDIKKIIGFCSQIEELQLCLTEDLLVTEEFLELKNLNKFSITSFRGNSEIIKFVISDLSKMDNLIELRLVGLSDSNFSKEWCTCKNLEKISLDSFWDFTDFPKEVEELSRLKKLELRMSTKEIIELELENWEGKYKCSKIPENIVLMKNLEELNLDIDLCEIDVLTELKNLKKLEILGTRLSDLNNFKSFNKLKVLKISSSELKDISSLKYLENLKVLKIDCSGLKDISALEYLIDLKELDLTMCQRLEDIEAIKHLENLETLILEDTDIKSLSAIRGLENLKELNIKGIRGFRGNEKKITANLLELKSLNKLEKVIPEWRNLEELKELQKSRSAELGSEEILRICKSEEKKI